MSKSSEILCIGSVLWDIIGNTPRPMPLGSDKPGRITRLAGGVAMNVAIATARFGLRPVLLSAVGRDAEGEELIAACTALGGDMQYVYRSDDLPTDRYMAIEGADGLVAAIADAHSLEAAGNKILTPLFDGRLGSKQAPYSGRVALDGNLTVSLLEEIATQDAFGAADLRIASASPGKADRLAPFVRHGRGVLYVNLEEAGLLCGTQFDTAEAGARGLLSKGAARVLVTNGGDAGCDGSGDALICACPPAVTMARVTGAGDLFMAAHIAAEAAGMPRAAALDRALSAAAAHVAGETPQ